MLCTQVARGNMMLQASAGWDMCGHASPHARAERDAIQCMSEAASAPDAVGRSRTHSHAPKAVVCPNGDTLEPVGVPWEWAYKSQVARVVLGKFF